MSVSTVTNVENNETRIEKNVKHYGSGHFSLVSLTILVHSSHFRVVLFCITPRSWDKHECFKLLKTLDITISRF